MKKIFVSISILFLTLVPVFSTDFKEDDAFFKAGSGIFSSVEKAVEDVKAEMSLRRTVDVLQDENNMLYSRNRDLEYKNNKLESEMLPLRLRYNICSKLLFFSIVYQTNPKEMLEYFTDEELKIYKQMLQEWKTKYGTK